MGVRADVMREWSRAEVERRRAVAAEEVRGVAAVA